MHIVQSAHPVSDAFAFLKHSETGRRIAALDWAATPLGPPAAWPQPLRTLLGVALGSAQPMFIAWGPQRTLIYNDAYAAILAAKHPAALGRDFLDVWHEIRADLLPIVEQAYGGEPVHMDDLELWMERRGFREETHFAFSYTPVRDEDGTVAGFFCACQEITGQVLAERRLRESERRFRAVQDSSIDGFMVLDAVRDDRGALIDFRWAHANEAAARIVGRPHGWFPGRRLLQEMPGNREEGLFDIYARVVETGEPWQNELRYAHEGVDVHLRITAAKAGDGFAVTFSDLSERARTEARLREASERVQLALDAGAIIGTWVWDVTADRFTVDEAFARAFGLDPALGREGLSLEQVVATVHPDDQQGLSAAIAEAIARGGKYAHQYRVRRTDGRHYWIEANGRVDHLPGDRIRFPGVLLDMDERRAVQAERDRALDLLRAFTEAVPGVVYAKDREGRMLVANRGTAELIGKPPEAFLGLTDAEFLDDPEQAASVMANDARIMDSGEAEQVEEVVSFPDGRQATWLSTKAPLRDVDGTVVGLIGSSVDISARKRTEAELAQSEERFRFALEAAGGIGTWDWDVATDTVATSAQFASMYGLDPDRATAGLPVAEYVAGVHPDDRPEVERLIAEAVASGGDYRAEYRLVGADGDVRWVVARGRCMKDAAGRPVRFPGVTFDITDRKRAELAVRELNADLETRIEAAVAARLHDRQRLAEAEEALRQSQKLEAMGQLTGGVAHDFNNLLTPIVGALDMLQRRQLGDERVRRLIDGALQSAERARVLVQRLLAFARRQPLQPVAVDLKPLVENMADLIASTAGPRIRVIAQVDDDLPAVLADANQVEMAILNLGVNARDAMPDGGELRLAASTKEVPAGHRTKLLPGRYVCLSVIDTGVGMDEETQCRAVEPFFTTKGVGKGTGLGLSMAHGLTAQLGGAMCIHSRLGEGTTIELWLPLAETPASSIQTRDALGMHGTGKVLLVDDEDIVRDATAHMLADLGYGVVEARSADEALHLVGCGLDPDLLVTDHLMPGMSGTELARLLRSSHPGLRVLVISGYAESSGIDPALPRLTKPFRQDELAAALADTDSNRP